MATFSLGTSGITPGAPGVYVNEQPGKLANADLASFSTVYMLVEAEDSVTTIDFPFNRPLPVTSLEDYRALLGRVIPSERIPALSYQCVNEFFQNAQIGDLRVVRVGTPDQIVEIEFLPSANKINSSSLPSGLQAGDKVYVQMTINGLKLVDGDGSTGYTANGEWLGVPVIIPVNYVAGDEVNNRKISAAIAAAVSAAIESNPAVSASVYVRDTGMTNDKTPGSNSETSFVTIASTTFNGNVSVVTEVFPVGSNYVFMQNAYDIENIVGGSTTVERVPQDYTQCINTAFDGQQDQGYLITPTAYAQFDSAGRALVGAAAAAHCENNNFKWLALADPGPFLITDVNKYEDYTPHKAAADLTTGMKYLVDNAIYEWTGTDVTYNKLSYQSIVFGQSAETAVNESANLVAADTRVGMLDNGVYTITSPAGVDGAIDGRFVLDTDQYWPVTLPIQKVTLKFSGTANDFSAVEIWGDPTATVYNLNGQEVYVVAGPFDKDVTGDYSLNTVMLALTPADAAAVYNYVNTVGGIVGIGTGVNVPGAIYVPAPGGTGSTAEISYADPYWDLPVDVNGQTSDLIENITTASAGVNTLHLPGTLQDPTETYRLNWHTRTILDADATIGVSTIYPGAAEFSVNQHGLSNGQVIFFTQPITTTSTTGTSGTLFSATTKLVSRPYWVRVTSTSAFVLASSLANFTVDSYVSVPAGFSVNAVPTILYSRVVGGGLLTITPTELLTIPMIRGRKYAFDSSNAFNQAAIASAAPAPNANNPGASIYLNNSSQILGQEQISPYGEDLTAATKCGWLPKLNLSDPDPSPVAATNNAYCVPTVDQVFQPEIYLVPAIDAILAGDYDGAGSGTIGPVASIAGSGVGGNTDGTYTNVTFTGSATGTGLRATIVIAGGSVTSATVTSAGNGYAPTDTLDPVGTAFVAGLTFTPTINTTSVGFVAAASGTYGPAAGVVSGLVSASIQAKISSLVGCYFDVTVAGTAPDGVTAVAVGDRLGVVYNGVTYSWVVVPPAAQGGDLTSIGQPCYGSQVELVFTPEQTPPSSLWRFDAITSTEIIDDALRGVGFNGVPQAVFVDAGVDNVNRLLEDSQRYFNPFGFIAYYGPWIENGAGVYIPPSPYVTGVALRRYRAEGYQFPPAGVKYQLADAVAAQIPINSAQQNLLNPRGCNAVRTLPGYPQTAVFIWGGRTRVNEADAQQRLYQFVNTRVILNVVYGSLRTAFDSQIFNVIDGFSVVYNQIISVGNSILNQLYVRGALFGARPSDAFQVICDARINPPESLENGIVNAKVFVTPVPTLERIQIDLIRVALGKMQDELNIQGLGTDNASGTALSTRSN